VEQGSFVDAQNTSITILVEVHGITVRAWKNSLNKNQKKVYRRLFGGSYAEE
jgi:hypothetical protein